MTNEHPITPLPYPLRHCSPYQLRYCSLEQHPTPPPRPPMTDLSPAAQAVLDAYRDFSWRPDEEDNGRYYKWSHRAGIAAALRALAVRINGANAIRQDILDIADELEAQ